MSFLWELLDLSIAYGILLMLKGQLNKVVVVVKLPLFLWDFFCLECCDTKIIKIRFESEIFNPPSKPQLGQVRVHGQSQLESCIQQPHAG